MGKTFTLDPISKRRLDNFGEEDQFYIRDHHEAIISDAKRAKLVDMRLEEIIDKDTYEQKYFDLSSQIEQLQKQRESLQEFAETDSTMKKQIAEFRRTLEENEVLDTFDRYVFESIVEIVIVVGYDEDGNINPSMPTFIYKTGFKSSLDGTNFKPPRKNSKAAKQSAGLCSHTTDEAKSMCSYHSDDACRKRIAFQTNLIHIQKKHPDGCFFHA